MFTYMKFRIERGAAESVLPRVARVEPQLDPRPSYNLVVEDAEGFSGWAGIDSIEGTDSAQVGWYLLLGPLGTRLRVGGHPVLARLRFLRPAQSHHVGNR